jgi:hypothetical protein
MDTFRVEKGNPWCANEDKDDGKQAGIRYNQSPLRLY